MSDETRPQPPEVPVPQAPQAPHAPHGPATDQPVTAAGAGYPPSAYGPDGQAAPGYALPAPPYVQPGQPYPQQGPAYAQPGQPYAQPGPGYAQPGPGYGYPPQAPRPGNGMAVAALVTGIVALLVCLIPFVNAVSILAGIAGVVLGVIGLRAARDRQGAGRGMSIAGLITGAVALVVAAVVLTVTIVAMQRVAEQTAEISRMFDDLGSLEGLEGLEGLGDLEGLDLGLDDLAGSLDELAVPSLVAPEPAAVVGMGEPVTDGDMEFTVTGLEIVDTADNVQARGQYVVIDLTLRYTGTSAAMYSTMSQLLEDDLGNTHNADASALYELGSDIVSLVEPGDTMESTLVYDIPVDATPQRVVLSNTMLSTAVAVDLG